MRKLYNANENNHGQKTLGKKPCAGNLVPGNLVPGNLVPPPAGPAQGCTSFFFLAGRHMVLTCISLDIVTILEMFGRFGILRERDT